MQLDTPTTESLQTGNSPNQTRTGKHHVYETSNKNKLIEDTLADLLVLGKRYIYSTRMAETIPTPITIKHELVARIKILTLLRSSLSLNFSLSKLSAEYIEHNIY